MKVLERQQQGRGEHAQGFPALCSAEATGNRFTTIKVFLQAAEILKGAK